MSTFELTHRDTAGVSRDLRLPAPARLFAEEFIRIEDAFEELIRGRGGDGYDGSERFSVMLFLDHSEQPVQPAG